MTPPTAEEQDSLLAAMAGIAADRDLNRLHLITRGKSAGATWAAIGQALGMTGPEAKRHARHLAKRAGQAWRLEQNREAAAPYIHTFAAPEPTSWDDDGNPVYPELGPAYTMAGPGVVTAED